MDKHKLYFGCALSGLSREHREKMIALRETFRDSFEILEFCDPKEVGDREIYRYDIHNCVKIADLMIAVVDERGTALGYEMGTMIEKHGKPVLAVAQTEAVVSPFIRGIDHPKFKLERYKVVEEIKPMLLAFEKKMFPTSS